MQNDAAAAAIVWGAFAVLVFVCVLVARRVTADDSPVEQKAKRGALLISVLGASLILFL